MRGLDDLTLRLAHVPTIMPSSARPRTGLTTARRGARAIWRALGLEDYRRRRFRLRAGPAGAGQPVIYFLTPDYNIPAGGIRVIYRHVDILNAAGLPAFVLHGRRGFRCSWFENQTPVTDVSKVRVAEQDLLVLPELDIDLLAYIGSRCRHVIFNQNSHLTWTRSVSNTAAEYQSNSNLAGIVTVSEHNAGMLRSAFSDRPIGRVRLGINPALFHPHEERRENRITYMPRRGHSDARQVLAILGGRGLLKDWEVVPLTGLGHEEVAAQLRRSKIFLAFTYQEGFGLPAAEAMACGNYVIGHHGFGGREFFNPRYCTPIEAGDTMGFVEAVERVIVSEANAPGWCRTHGLTAAKTILEHYSLEHEREDVIATYGVLVASRPPEAGVS